jgi:Ca2+/H+ antiporter
VLASRFGSTRPDIGLGLELDVITATVLGGVDIMGGSGTMVGAILSLFLIGVMRFGMGLMNIQGQVQSIAIGMLLILSILLPHLVRRFSRRGGLKLQPRPLLVAVIAVLIAILFGWFFVWSRAAVLNAEEPSSSRPTVTVTPASSGRIEPIPASTPAPRLEESGQVGAAPLALRRPAKLITFMGESSAGAGYDLPAGP